MSVKSALVWLVVSLAWFSPAHALVVAYKCNACSEAQYLAKAQSVAAEYNLGSPLTPYAYIYDLAHGNLRKYAVSREPIPGGYDFYIEPVATSSAENNLWMQVHSAIAANGGSSAFFINIDAVGNPGMPDRNASAYDIAQTGAFQADISDWLLFGTNHPPSLAQSIALTTVSLVGMAAQIILKADPFSMTATIHTIDHGQAKFHWEAGYSEAEFTGAWDVNNNPIPVTSNQLPGQYRLRTGSSGPFFDYLNSRFGTQVFINGPNVCTNGLFACTNSAAGYSCQWVTCGGVP